MINNNNVMSVREGGMKGVIKQGLLLALMIQVPVYAPFSDDIEFNIELTDNSRWGVFYGSENPAELSMSCYGGDLEGVTIENNDAKGGMYSGTTSTLQLCPCTATGVSYWNPLSIIQKYDPCALSHLSPAGNGYSGDCAGSALVLAEGKAIEGTSSGVSTQKAGYTKLMNVMSAQLDNIPDTSENHRYAVLADTITQEADFLIKMSEVLNPDTSKGQSFLSVPYLRFCTSYGQNFLTSSSLEKTSESLFGSGVDVSTYFPDGKFVAAVKMGSPAINTSGAVRGVQKGSSLFGGVLIRAQEKGYIKQATGEDILKVVGPVTPAQAQKVIEKYANVSGTLIDYPNIIGDRALLEELFFLQLAMMQPMPIATGMYNPSVNTIRKAMIENNESYDSTINVGINAVINKGPFTDFPGTTTKTPLSEIYANLFTMGRYVRGLNVDANNARPAYAPQPVDTFYGAIIVNNGTLSGGSVDILSSTNWMNYYPTGSVGFFAIDDGGVDQWTVAGINALSGLKYRKMTLQVMASSSGDTLGSIELQIEEGSGGSVYESGTQKVFPPGIALFDKVNNKRTTLSDSSTINEFFNLSPSAPWAVVVEATNEGGTSDPWFKLVGIARLNPEMFPLQYKAPGPQMGNLTFRPFNVEKFFSARSKLYENLVKMHGTKVDVKMSGTRNGQNVELGQVTTPEVNMNLVKFNGALNYGWGGTTPLITALNSIEQIMNGAFLTRDLSKPINQQINGAQMKQLVKNATTNNNPKGILVPVSTKTFGLLSVVATKEL